MNFHVCTLLQILCYIVQNAAVLAVSGFVKLSMQCDLVSSNGELSHWLTRLSEDWFHADTFTWS